MVSNFWSVTAIFKRLCRDSQQQVEHANSHLMPRGSMAQITIPGETTSPGATASLETTATPGVLTAWEHHSPYAQQYQQPATKQYVQIATLALCSCHPPIAQTLLQYRMCNSERQLTCVPCQEWEITVNG